ncbi:MAG TPA: MFS transporter [Fimbriimonadaceae bacterium]|nr:MFS transporter [Fimbriimonadaceae bacterium]
MTSVSRSQAALYAAIFLDLFGFGMILPDVQLRAEKMGAPGWLIGTILASTFLVQLLVSPKWGSLSDRVGRKPILLACTALSAAAMVFYGLAGAIPLLFASRIVAGLGGANVAIAQALLADTTTDVERSVAMGRIGAAISAGLVAGPSIGGFLGHQGSLLLGMVAGSCSAFGVLLMALLVSGAKPREDRPSRPKAMFDFSLLRSLPGLRRLVLVAAVAWFSLATLEGTFGRLIEHTLGYDQRQFGIVFGYESLLGFLVQAFLIGWIAKRVRDDHLLRSAYLLQGLGLGLTPFTYLFPVPGAWMAVLLFWSTFYAIGSGLANPTINSLCSKITPDDRQGELFGLLQGARSIGFIFGPALGGALFDVWTAAPYLLAGFTCAVASAIVPSVRSSEAT